MGINIIVLNQVTGAATASRSFDTYMSKLDSKLLMSFIDSLPEERIICFTIKVCRSPAKKHYTVSTIIKFQLIVVSMKTLFFGGGFSFVRAQKLWFIRCY